MHLPAETQLYVPRVEATIREYEGVRLDQLSEGMTGGFSGILAAMIGGWATDTLLCNSSP